MKSTKVAMWIGLSLAFLLVGCRSRQEAAGDKFRKGGDPINALIQYDEALKRGKVSSEFYKNYTAVCIQTMSIRAKDDPGADFLKDLKDTILSILKQYPSPENEAAFAKTLQDVGTRSIAAGNEEGGMEFLSAAQSLPNQPADVGSRTGALRMDYTRQKLKEIEGDYDESKSEPTAGITADYKMNKLALIHKAETPEMLPLWSKIRQQNLSTYLMYDLEGLLSEHPDARINMYGVLLAIVKLDKGATKLSAQVKAFNGSSTPITFDGEGFVMVDRAGGSHKPTAKIGAFGKKAVVGIRDESKTGGLTFTYESGTEPWYIEFKSEGGLTRKYLP